MSYLLRVFENDAETVRIPNPLVFAGGITIPSGATLTLASGATLVIADGALEAPDLALAQGSMLIGDSGGKAAALNAKTSGQILVGNGTTLVSVALSSDATLAANGALTIANDAITTAKILAANVTLAKIEALASARLIVGNASNRPTAVDVTGDVTISNAGVTAIGANKVLTAHINDGNVTAAKLANGAGIAALLTAGLGNSANYPKTTDGAQTLLTAHGTKDRAVLIVITVTETFAAGDGAAPSFVIGETDTTNKFKASFNTGTAGDIIVLGGMNTTNKAVLVTGTAATGTGAGAISVAVLAIPTT